eukprot:CAMPEP_0115859220 /NCGR_PEP_ID=MMETSP0287-20121206/16503_1 /TAXON_ID=412157 /ORGANISM="Chrysochromulina rotalis, Strain UIO044" /LENGTH=195 /DNA_ID=CAMNT_0003313513 /DNA_START=196 /DNA_END=784 /DNA_ORIENTATION=+
MRRTTELLELVYCEWQPAEQRGILVQEALLWSEDVARAPVVEARASHKAYAMQVHAKPHSLIFEELRVSPRRVPPDSASYRGEALAAKACFAAAAMATCEQLQGAVAEPEYAPPCAYEAISLSHIPVGVEAFRHVPLSSSAHAADAKSALLMVVFDAIRFEPKYSGRERGKAECNEPRKRSNAPGSNIVSESTLR